MIIFGYQSVCVDDRKNARRRSVDEFQAQLMFV